MKIHFGVLLLLFLFLPGLTLAAPPEDLMAKLIDIADPDQVEAYSKLNLSAQQETSLKALIQSYAPQFQQAKGQPAQLMGLVSEALGKADGILTPSQRPLIRKLLPRPHQWEKLKTLR